jgi:hypothetical protein
MKIEKKIPVPAPRRGRGGVLSDTALTLLAMDSGDSFFIEDTSKKEQRKAYNTIFKMATRHGVAIQGRHYAEGIRIWKR